MEPVFGGVHAAERRRAAQRRALGSAVPEAAAALPDLSQIYVVRVDPRTDLLAVAADFRRDTTVVWAEPNYLYKAADATVIEAAGGRTEYSPFSIHDSPVAAPSDPFFSSSGSWGQSFPDLWGLFQIEAPAAWELSQGEGVVVAVVDTGVDIEHPDIAANIWHNSGEIAGNGVDDDGNGFVDDLNGWDFTRCVRTTDNGCPQVKEPGPDVGDPAGHGTHVAGSIAAVGDNGIGMIGVAPKAQLIVVKGLDQSERGSNRDLGEALVYAAENGAQVINASWSGPPSETIRMAVEYAAGLGAVVVAAAGNEGAPLEQAGQYPANLPEVVTVGATTHTDEQAAFSNFGGALDLVAPGGGDSEPASDPDPRRSILSLLAHDSAWSRQCRESDGEPVCELPPWVIEEEYVRAAGTSFAAPHVSGVAALVRSRHPAFTRQQVRQVLLQSADDLGSTGWDPTVGYGRVNARRAVDVDVTPVAEINVPENRGKVREEQFPFEVKGTVLAPGSSVREWRLSVRRAERGRPRVVARGTEPVGDGMLGMLELGGPARLLRGRRYVLELDVEDAQGNVAVDSKAFLIPSPQFAAIPISDPYDEGGESGSISGDGKRAALSRNNSVWIFDFVTRARRRIANASGPRMSADGRMLAYAGGPPLGGSCPSLSFAILYNIDSQSYLCLPFGVGTDAIGTHGYRLGFISTLPNLDPKIGNPDGSYEAFTYDVIEDRVQQVTNGPRENPQPEVANLVMSGDGTRVLFTSRTSFDATALTGHEPQVFSYDDRTRTFRQLTGRAESWTAQAPALSADGSSAAYEKSAADTLRFEVIDLLSDELKLSVGGNANQFAAAGFPRLSVDGSKLAVQLAADLDPKVANEDLNPEIFIFDVPTGAASQATDTVNTPFGQSLDAMDMMGDVAVITSAGEIGGTGLSPPSVRVVTRRRPNRQPVLQVPSSVRLEEGRAVRLRLEASDPDGDAVVFHVQFPDRKRRKLRDFAGGALLDDGHGTAILELAPRYNEAGEYTLRVAAFDEAGGVAISDVNVTVADTQPEGDANCDGTVDEQDIPSLVVGVFDADSRDTCVTMDADDDGRISAADLTALVKALGGA